jgi:hypothetical protein
MMANTYFEHDDLVELKQEEFDEYAGHGAYRLVTNSDGAGPFVVTLRRDGGVGVQKQDGSPWKYVHDTIFSDRLTMDAPDEVLQLVKRKKQGLFLL